MLTWASLTYTLVNLFIYLLLLLGFDSKLGKIPNSLQTQTYFSQIHPSWCLQATTVVDPPPLFFDQNEAQRAEKNFFGDRPPHPYLRVWMTSTPAYLKVWMHHCMILNKVSYREARSQGLTPYPNLQRQGKAPWGQGCPYPFTKPFWTEKVPLLYIFDWQMVSPSHI